MPEVTGNAPPGHVTHTASFAHTFTHIHLCIRELDVMET